jgi:uncharacterized membrane protein YqjE
MERNQVTRVEEGLPALFAKTADDLARLVDAKVALLQLEIKEDISTLARNAAAIVAGAAIALVGLALLNVALAFLLSTLFNGTSLSQPARYGLGFALMALVYLIIGGVIVAWSKNKLAAQDFAPERSIAELRRDTERLKQEM